MIVKRNVQKITSPYGRRGVIFHKGVDLRTWTDDFKQKLPIVLPEDCIFSRKVFQEKWGYTFVFAPIESGYDWLKFIHMIDNENLIVDRVYRAGDNIGYTGLTDYMKKKNLGDHLHFETWKKSHMNPTIYCEQLDIKYV